jgi:septal ring factor EnvC (AmiA/AmiB activator)
MRFRCLLLLVLFGLVSCDVATDMNNRIYELKADNEALLDKISLLEHKAEKLSAEIEDLNSQINDISIEDFDSQMIDIHLKLDDVEDQLQNLKTVFKN